MNVAIWAYVWWLRAAVVGRIAPVVLLVLSIVELGGPLAHVVQFKHEPPLWVRFAIAGLLAVAAIVLTYHHTRLRVRIERLEVVLASMGPLLDEEGGRESGEHNNRHITAILDALVFVTQHPNKRITACATVVTRKEPDGAFEIAYQDTRNHFDGESVVLDGESSVAGTIAKEASGTLIYVPSTQFKHGIKITRTDSIVPKKETFKALEIVPSAFQIINENHQAAVKCLLCVQVPSGHGTVGKCDILCLSIDRPRRMGSLEFSAIKWAAALISFVFKDPKGV